MKPCLKIVLSIIVLIIIVLCYIVVERVPNENGPKKLNNIPKNAIWKGAPDEGFWIEVVNIDSTKRTIRLKIYNDYNGQLALDANFSEQSNCNIDPFIKKNIINNIIAFASQSGIEKHDEIMMKNNCNLKMIKPGYGGSFME